MPTIVNHIYQRPEGTAARPLTGMTVLVVEDSRFASEAIRLLCLRSGARIRRADTLRAARRHLRVYMPTCVIVDVGLPDGSGLDLISDLDRAATRIPVILAITGDDAMMPLAGRAGADGVLSKPLDGLAEFQSAVLTGLPEDQRPQGPRPLNAERVSPDRLALRDDLSHIADVLTTSDDDQTIDYVAQFLHGVARSAGDGEMESAAEALARHRSGGRSVRSDLARVAGLLQNRIEGCAAL